MNLGSKGGKNYGTVAITMGCLQAQRLAFKLFGANMPATIYIISFVIVLIPVRQCYGPASPH